MRSRGFHTHAGMLETREKMHHARKKVLDLTAEVAMNHYREHGSGAVDMICASGLYVKPSVALAKLVTAREHPESGYAAPVVTGVDWQEFGISLDDKPNPKFCPSAMLPSILPILPDESIILPEESIILPEDSILASAILAHNVVVLKR